MSKTPHLLKQFGLPPGTPVFIGEQRTDSVKMTVMDYSRDHSEVKHLHAVEECVPYQQSSTVSWINIDGLHDISILEKIGHGFELHPLTIEDILNTQQRPKIEIFDTYILLILKMHTYDTATRTIATEQVSSILGKTFVITFQEQEGDVFAPIRARIQHGTGRIRKSGADYLAYSLLDAIVDGYFEVLEHLEDDIEQIEEQLFDTPDTSVLNEIHTIRRELILFRKSVWPLRTILTDLERREIFLIDQGTTVYFRDLYDHIIQVIDTLETFRELILGHLDVYLSSLSNKMNEIMKFLTIIGTIFIPLTFLAGIYGMNFQYMPELSWRWGYWAILAFMAGIGGALLFYFKKKHWL